MTLDDIFQILDEPWTAVNNDREALRRAFEKFDHTQEGYIDIDHFRTVMSTLGEPLSDEELDGLIQMGLNEDQTKISIDCKSKFVFFRKDWTVRFRFTGSITRSQCLIGEEDPWLFFSFFSLCISM